LWGGGATKNFPAGSAGSSQSFVTVQGVTSVLTAAPKLKSLEFGWVWLLGSALVRHKTRQSQLAVPVFCFRR
jgi:hypothetical protein